MKDKKFLSTLAFVGMVIFGLVWFVTSLLGLIGVQLSGNLGTVVAFFKAIATLLVVLVLVIVGWEAASGKKLVWQIIFFVFAILSVAGAIMGIFG
ncbi:MAG TPA: hypothetical protein PLP51_02370 [Acholeplasmataceae bacterium]|jgi:hypothetical protein|nr:hypothetical protein [Acholeplasmataceae bacterium]HPX71536.1 hypothetical protein [Acholeplasmataceae bacterium]HQC30561.1 hypothetical protein [Acholeplasmataceae bacterium]